MAYRLTVPSGLHGWSVPVHPDQADLDEPATEPVAGSCLAVAAAWAAVIFEMLYLRAGGWIPEGTLGGRFPAAMALCAGTGATSLFAAALYRLPAGLGGRLRFPRLAWTHLAVLNGAALGALLFLATHPGLSDLTEDRLVGALTGVLGAGIAAMIVNVVASLDGETWRV